MLAAAAVLRFCLLQPPAGLSLAAIDAGDQLYITWNRAAQPIRNATGGSLEIQERDVRAELKFTAVDLQSGNVTYEPQSGDVVLKLIVYRPRRPPLAETVHFMKTGEPERRSGPIDK